MKHIKKMNEALKVKSVKMIDSHDWDMFVSETYGRIYCLQQQNGCQERGIVHITIPSKWAKSEDDDMHDSIPEVVNGSKMGVKFKTWLERDPKQPIPENDFLYLFWQRNFYPSLAMVGNDLYNKGLIEAGDYQIDIDW